MCRQTIAQLAAGLQTLQQHRALTTAPPPRLATTTARPAGLMSSTPLFLWDHVAAVLCWLVLYGVEVALILGVYARYPEPDQAVRA